MKRIEINWWEKSYMLTLIKELPPEPYLSKKWVKHSLRKVLCKCECWKEKVMRFCHFRNGSIKSCWCIVWWKNTHWLHKTRIYNIWCWMKARCNNKNEPAYKNYWARWIAYNHKRETFEWFLEDMEEWYLDNLTLDRIDNDWNYCKENCRRATRKEQNRNSRSCKYYMYNWIKVCLWELYEIAWVTRSAMEWRLKKWLDIREATWLSKDVLSLYIKDVNDEQKVDCVSKEA